MSLPPIGLLCLDTHFAKPPGHIRNLPSLPFPVIKHRVAGASIDELLNRPSPALLAPFVEGVKALERQGCAAITGSCGFMALYQQELADAVSIPVFSSSLIQIPLMYQMAGRRGRIGVLTADSRALTPRHLEAVGAADIPIAVAGMEEQTEFREVILQARRNELDTDKVTGEVLKVARGLCASHDDIRAVVLECTDLPPYAKVLQDELGLPIADLTTLATMVHDIVARQAYRGSTVYD